MEKFLVTPIKNSENGSKETDKEINCSLNEADEGEIEIIEENLTEKTITPIPNSSKTLKLKKLKLKKGRGEKRKFPDVLDSIKKIKRKKREEKHVVAKDNLFEQQANVEDVCELKAGLISHDVAQPVLLWKGKMSERNSSAVENECDVENDERMAKPRSSRKSKAIASNCQDTLNVLLKFDLDVLILLDKSLKIVKSHSLLNNRYMSIEILIDLIALALEKSKTSEDGDSSEKDLSAIISKCTNKMSATPRRSKVNLNILPLSPNSSVFQKEASAVHSLPNSLNVTNKENEVFEENKSTETEERESEIHAVSERSDRSEENTVEISGKNFCITNYFKKLKKNVEERDKNERFSCFTTKTDMFLAPKLGGELTGERRNKFERAFDAQDSESHCYIAELLRRPRHRKTSQRKAHHNSRAEVIREPTGGFKEKLPFINVDILAQATHANDLKQVSLVKVDGAMGEPIEGLCRTKAKLLQFHDNRRPPYWGTWRRQSAAVGPRRPLAKEKMLNYEVDSDDEWEEEEEAGESLCGSDEEKEPDEDYEVDNEFFVPHGYLSDDENPEKENSSLKSKLDLLEQQFTSEQKQKMGKMTPIVFGVFWMHQGTPERTFYYDSQMEKLQYVPWTSTPVEIEEESEEVAATTKKSKQKVFPYEEIPDLIKMIHGSPHNCDRLAKEFLLTRTARAPEAHRPGLTKVCVQKKIRELATWQTGHDKGKMCWQVPKETRLEFGADDREKTPEKKPRKCFIWKFVRRAEKFHETRKSPPPDSPSSHPPSSIEPELLVLES